MDVSSQSLRLRGKNTEMPRNGNDGCSGGTEENCSIGGTEEDHTPG